MKLTYDSIGTVYSEHKTPQGTPIQAALAETALGRIELKTDYVQGLKDLEGFSHIILIYHFHLSQGWSPLVKPFLDDMERGVFATRAPKRPNPIGLSVVKLERIEGNILHISGVDIVDGTPVLDIKPFAPAFDHRSDCRSGWLEEASTKKERHVADARFSGKHA